MDRFTELALFVEVAERGSLSAAASHLGLSRPSATRILAALEQRLQVRLVERNTRRSSLTGEGLEFLDRARHVLAELSEAEAAIQRQSVKPSGVLRLSASLSFAMQMIAPRLPLYHQRYPQVRVHIETANRYLDLIDHGIDLAIRTREYEPDSSVTIRRLASTRRLLAASPAYLARRGRPLHPNELSQHDLLLYIHANKPDTLIFSHPEQPCTVQVQGLLESNDGQVLRAAALKGLGILVQPSYIIYEDIVAGRLVPILEDWDLPRLQINLVYPSRRYLPAKVRTFTDFMLTEFALHDYERKWTSRI